MNKVSKAQFRKTDYGLERTSEGWFVVNATELAGGRNPRFGSWIEFEGDVRFPHLGINIHLLEPGKPACHYHAESDQEDFLVLQGNCKLIIEGEEIGLKQWDFVHCPPWTKHLFVGGSERCAVLMIGARGKQELIYTRDPAAERYNGCTPEETSDPKVSYRDIPKHEKTKPDWPFKDV